jgi:hypothetical protein
LTGPRDSPAIELSSEVGAIHRVNEDESPGGVFGLVALDPILAYVSQSGGKGSTHGLRTVRLGDSDDPHAVAPPADLLVSSHRIAYSGQPGREAWEVHNPLIYQGMLHY